MQKLIILISIILLPTVASAKCMSLPKIKADIEIFSCQQVTFFATPSKTKESGDVYQLQKPNTSVSGTLFSGVVKNSSLVWKTPKYETDKTSWAQNSIVTLYTETPATEVCPKVVPETKSVIEADICCDTFPAEGVCLIPFTIPKVTLEK